MSGNYYEILGVSKDASQLDIKRKFRAESLKCHPDKTSDPELHKKFLQLNEAYETLGNEDSRSQYDKKLAMGLGPNDELPNFPGMSMFHGMGPGMGPGIRIFTSGDGMPPDIENIFSMLHGMGGMGGMGFRPQGGMMKPRPIVVHTTISLETMLNGGVVTVEYDRVVKENGVNFQKPVSLNVSIPKGIDEGEVVIVTDMGNMVGDQYGITGDVHIVVHINNTSSFERRGLDFIYKAKIPLKDALCGFKLELTHPNGKIFSLSGASGKVVTPGLTKTIPDLGVQKNNSTGNMIVVFDVVFPETLTLAQVEVLREAL